MCIVILFETRVERAARSAKQQSVFAAGNAKSSYTAHRVSGYVRFQLNLLYIKKLFIVN